MTDIMLQAYQVLDEIRSEQTYQEIKRLDKVMLELYRHEIQVFQRAKIKYDQIMAEGGSYHPDFKEVVKAFAEAKSNLYSKEEVKRYFELEKSLQDEINDFLAKISETVSPYVKSPDKMGIIKKGGSCHVH